MFDWFWEFLYSIQKAILYLIDFIVSVFRLLAGLNDVSIPVSGSANGETEETDILSYLFQSTAVTRAFIYVVVLSFALLIILTIIAIIRKQYMEEREQRSMGAIMGTAMKTCLMFLLIPVIMIVANAFLIVFVQQLDLYTNPYYSSIVGSGQEIDGYSGVSVGGIVFYVIAYDAKISDEVTTGFITRADGYDYNILENVEMYYDISDINYFLGYLVGIVIFVLFVKSLFTFVERIFAIIGLYIVAPIAASSAVLDGGVRFKSWRDSVVNKFIIAYSVILAINLYFIIIPLILDITFLSDEFQNDLVQLFFVVGGAFAVNKSITWFGNIVNSGAGNQEQMESDSAGRGLWGAARSVGRTAVRAAGAVGSAGWRGFKNATGFVTPLERFNHRGQALREAKMKTRDEVRAKKWQDNFYDKHPDQKPNEYKRNYPASVVKQDITPAANTPVPPAQPPQTNPGQQQENGRNNSLTVNMQNITPLPSSGPGVQQPPSNNNNNSQGS